MVRWSRGGGSLVALLIRLTSHVHTFTLRRFDFISNDAQSVIDLGEVARVRDKKQHPAHLRLIVDHVVPFAVLGRELFRDPQLRDPAHLQAFLEKHFLRALITKDSDDRQRLERHKLGNGMPENWRFWKMIHPTATKR
ncbi:MAG TPA: hypothetical protein VF628_10950 [Allosphingosinicella sp.]|jgi:hypothetical protein